MITRHLIIKGKVQGVFYRASAKEFANSMGLSGWVKNTDEGNVEIVCQGEEEKVTEFINWCKTGPRRAKVENVEINEVAPSEFKDFQILKKT